LPSDLFLYMALEDIRLPMYGEALMKWRCRICGYVYDEAIGHPEKGVLVGTRFDILPADWSCPVCGAPKSEFEMIEQ